MGHRHGSDPTMLCLWHKPAAAAPIQPLAWELPYAISMALERKKKKKEVVLYHLKIIPIARNDWHFQHYKFKE